jgi:hypothetical protein
MTDPMAPEPVAASEPAATSEPAAATSEAAAAAEPAATSATSSTLTGAEPDFADRMKAFGQEASTRGQQLGREAQAAGDRWSKDRGLVRVASTASRIWGLILVLIGLWFFAEFTLGYSLPAVPWGELWPVALIVLGLLVIARGMARRA